METGTRSLYMITNQICTLVSIFLFHFDFGYAKNILFVNTLTERSHNVCLEELGFALAKNGHNVTVISPYPARNPPKNYTEILTDVKEVDTDDCQRANLFEFTHAQLMTEFICESANVTTETSLNSTALKNFVADKGNTYDLVVSEFSIQEAHVMFAELYDTPLILVTPVGNSMKKNVILRNQLQFSNVLKECYELGLRDGIIGKLRNLYAVASYIILWYYKHIPEQEELVNTYFKNLPADRPGIIAVLQERTSLVLMNTHYSANEPSAHYPNTVPVAGMHIKKTSPLPKDLQVILDKAKSGVIYMNFGSNIKFNELPNNTMSAFLGAFRKFNQTVLMKWEGGDLVDGPHNLVSREWLPQNDILAHPNVKVFICHGGLLSMHEAVFHGAPVIGIPAYADQFHNILHAERDGRAILLRYKDVSERTVWLSIDAMLNNPSYSTRAKEISARFKDRPMSGLDTALYWTEYVLRHNGAGFMKSPGLAMSWYSYYEYMLDSWPVIIFVYGFFIHFVLISVPRFIEKITD